MNNPSFDISVNILKEILKVHRRDIQSDKSDMHSHELELIRSVQIPRIQHFVEAGKPIEFVLPAFPAKSPNPGKVIGRLPDLAERLSLQSLDKLCADIQRFYTPGAHLTICSDGRVFGDVIGVDDNDISQYQAVIGRLIAQKHADHLRLYNLEDCTRFNAPSRDFDTLRQLMIDNHADSLFAIKSTLMKSDEGVALYRAISRFMFEDGLTPDYSGSRTALQRKAKLMAVEVIQRSWAWGDLLAKEFPHAIRLSIHPQAPSSLKIGIHMMPTHDCWITPWHGVAVETGGRVVLMSRKNAQLCGARLVMQDGQPSHYVMAASQVDELTPAIVQWQGAHA